MLFLNEDKHVMHLPTGHWLQRLWIRYITVWEEYCRTVWLWKGNQCARTETETVSRMDWNAAFDCCYSHQSVHRHISVLRQGSQRTFGASFV